MVAAVVDQWVIYARISDDREGAGLGVERQINEARTHHERTGLGGEIIAVCVDNDMTANDKSRRYKPRPEYARMCQLLAARPGRRGVITWHADRLHRNPRELEDFIDLVESAGAAVQTIKAGHLDLATPSGRMVARQLCAVAKYESEHKSERIRSKVAELAAKGTIYGGGPRPYGYTRIYDGTGTRRRIVRDEVNSEEAVIIRECVRRALAGKSISSIRRWLDGAGVQTSTGRQWSIQALKCMLTSGRIAGLREHQRRVVGRAVWDPIITLEQHLQLNALFGSRSGTPPTPRKYYLSGYVYCSACVDRGVKMRAGPVGGKPRYRCPPDVGGCNGRVIGIDHLEAHIDGVLIELMNDPRTIASLVAREADHTSAASDLVERIAGDERRLAVLAAALEDESDDSIPEVVASMRAARRRIAAAKESLKELSAGPAAGLDFRDLSRRWDDVQLTERRAVLTLFIDRIIVLPAIRGLGRFDKRRVRVVPVGADA